VQTLVSEIKTILYRSGRGDSWDIDNLSGNPAYAPELQDYVQAVKDEQAEAHVAKKQAKPMSFFKIKTIVTIFEQRIEQQRFITQGTISDDAGQSLFLTTILHCQQRGGSHKTPCTGNTQFRG
jgi:hypothetical protein